MPNKDMETFQDRMEKTIQNLEEEFNTIRVGRANPHILDKITVDYYGTPTPLQQVGNISVPEARMLLIQPWDSSLIKEIEKAIQASDVGINPSNDGKDIRLVFPELTEEKRKEEVKKKGEQAKVAIRNIRRDAMDFFKKERKENAITEDDQKDLEEKLQKMTDEYIKKVDKRIDAKIKEVMSV